MKSPRDFYTNPGQDHRRYNGDAISRDELQKLREVPLVQHAVGKCRDCGSTLCESPLPHTCGEPSYGVGDYGRCLL